MTNIDHTDSLSTDARAVDDHARLVALVDDHARLVALVGDAIRAGLDSLRLNLGCQANSCVPYNLTPRPTRPRCSCRCSSASATP